MTTPPLTDEQIERALGDRRRLAELYQHLDLPSILIEWKDFALGGGIPKVQSPHYALAGMLEWAAAEIERLRAKEPVAVEGLVERVGANGQAVAILDIGGRSVEVDIEIAPIVAALNAAGVETVASCSGHGRQPGNIALKDGREIIIARDFEEARKIAALSQSSVSGNETE